MHNRKLKKGFTLAEVLITLGIIGVIAAMTLPSFVSNSRYQAMATKLSSTISSIDNAFTTMLTAENADDITDTKFYDHINASTPNYPASTNDLGNYLKISGYKTGQNIATDLNYLNNRPFKDLSGYNNAFTAEVAYQMKNGAIIFYTHTDRDISRTSATLSAQGGTVSRFVAQVDIDVNGSENPNKYGRDVFRFGLGDNGHLYPAGSLNYSIITNGDDTYYWNKTSPDSSSSCDDTNGKTVGCTARLVEENFKINY